MPPIYLLPNILLFHAAITLLFALKYKANNIIICLICHCYFQKCG
ncbi:hypothetical protein CF65_00540 [Aggregatibacter actinomycetemcomitans HK1651]|nr:hypothetical protein CF65_00540 [Aggregatibacter actinomycetemcomitans HK1651]